MGNGGCYAEYSRRVESGVPQNGDYLHGAAVLNSVAGDDRITHPVSFAATTFPGISQI